MFKELMPVLADRPLTITVAAVADGKIRICVVPQSQDKDRKVNDKIGYQKEVARIPDVSIQALTTPLALTGTPEELDAELTGKLTSYSGAHAQLQHGIAQATQEISDALKAIEERNKTKSKTDSPGRKEDKTPTDQKPPDPEGTLPLSWLAQPSTPATAVSANDGQTE
jgi:PRTRC genetic system protein E